MHILCRPFIISQSLLSDLSKELSFKRLLRRLQDPLISHIHRVDSPPPTSHHVATKLQLGPSLATSEATGFPPGPATSTKRIQTWERTEQPTSHRPQRLLLLRLKFLLFKHKHPLQTAVGSHPFELTTTLEASSINHTARCCSRRCRRSLGIWSPRPTVITPSSVWAADESPAATIASVLPPAPAFSTAAAATPYAPAFPAVPTSSTGSGAC